MTETNERENFERRPAATHAWGFLIAACLALAGILPATAAAPANDSYTNAQVIAGVSGSLSFPNGSTVGATNEPAEPAHAGFLASNSVWFSWTAPISGDATFDTFANFVTDFDTVLAVYTNTTSLATLVEVASNDNIFFFPGPSFVSFPVRAGVEYRIAVDGRLGASGNFDLNWEVVNNGLPAVNEIQFFTTNSSVLENTPGFVTIAVLYGGGAPGDVTVEYATSDISAAAGNAYTPRTGTLTFTNGETIQLFTVLILDNAVGGTNLTFGLSLSSTTGGAVLGPLSNAVVTIVDDETANFVSTAGEFNFSSFDYRVTENESFWSALDNFRSVPGALITVIRTNGSTGRVLVDYETEDASAIAFFDYTPQQGTLIFDDFQMSTNFIVPVSPSFFGFPSPNIFVKQVNLKLSNPRAAPGENPGLIRPTLGSVSSAFLGIAQVRAPLAFAFERLQYRVDEYGGKSITVGILNGHTNAGSVDIRMNSYIGRRLQAGSDYATPGVDFTDVSRRVAIGANGRATVTIPILDDSLVEFNEDIILTLENPSDDIPVHFFADTATVTILADEDPPGALDREWNRDGVVGTTPPLNSRPGANNVVSVVAVQDDGKTVLGGDFTAVNTVSSHHIARLNPDGSMDLTFNPGTGANDYVISLVLYPSNSVHAGKMLIGGGFSSFNGTQRNSIARLNANGSLDLTFNPGNGVVRLLNSIALQTNGQILVAGEFAFFDDAVRHGVARLNDDGSLDETFNVGDGGDNVVRVVAVQTDAGGTNKILVGGDFSIFNGGLNRGIARLNSDGSVDATFITGMGVNGPVHALAVQTNGAILVGGSFSEIDGRARNNISRLSVDGALDLSFQSGSGANDSVYTITFQPDGRPLIGGLFTSYNTTRRVGLARLKVNGSLDTTFLDTAYNHFAGLVNPLSFEPKNFVNSIAVQTNGNVIIGGSFTNLGGNACLEINNSGSYTPVWTRQNQRTRLNIASLIGTWGRSATNANPVQGPGNAEFTLGNYTIDENSPFLAITLRRLDGNLGTLDVLAGTVDRLAVGGVDYLGVTNSQIWAEFDDLLMRSHGSSASNYFFVTTLDDALIEGDETLDLSLTQVVGSLTLGGEFIPLGGALGKAESVMTIMDNDFPAGVFSFSSPVYHTNEYSAWATITVIRTNGFTGRVTVNYQTRPGTATAGQDYVANNGTLTFNSGITNQSFSVNIINDTTVEFDETVLLILTNATGGATLPGGLPTSTSTAILTIIDNDFLEGRVNFSSINYSASEADGFATITVTRTGGSVGVLNVQYATSDGTATNGLDYTGHTNVLSWNAGDSSDRTIIVPLSSDGLVEGLETVNLKLFNPLKVGALGSRTNAVLTILNSDAYGNLAFSDPYYVANENGMSVLITVVRTAGVAGRVTVDFATTPGTALIGTDYFPTNGTLDFLPGELSKQFSIGIVDDADADGDRTVDLALSNPINAGLGTVSSALLTIIDNESENVPAGSLDTAFNPTAQASQPVYALALQPNGRLLMAGDFTNVNSLTANRVARLTSAGFLDDTFNAGAGANDSVRAMVLQTDGKVLIGGSFTQINNTNRSRIGRLNIDGTVDQFFNPGSGSDGLVVALALQTDGKVLVGGAFSKFNGITSPGLVRLNTNGTVDTVFNANTGAGANRIVHAVAVQADGKVVIGGEFTVFNGINVNHLVRLHANGTFDGAFAVGTGPDSTVRSILVQPDGSLMVGGSFTNFDGVARNFLVRLKPSGALDPNFLAGDIGGNDSVLSLAQQTDGKLLVAGRFSRFNNVSRGRLTRLNADGTTDPTINFGSGANAFVSALVIQADQKIVLSGGFTTYDDNPQKNIARIHGGSIAGPGTLEFGLPVFLAAENSPEAVIVVKRRGGTTGPISADFATFDGTALVGFDYYATNGPLFFPQAETLATFTVRLIDNQLMDANRTVNLALGNYTGGAASGPQPIATLVINNDESLIGFSSTVYHVSEGSVSSKATIVVTRSGNTNTFVSVNFFTSTNGTATAGLDYSATNGVLSFLPGETIKYFNVFINEDTHGEVNETVGLVLQPVIGTGSALLGITNAVLTIADNETGSGVLGFSTNSYTVSEDGNFVTIQVIRTNGFFGTAAVNFNTSNGTALAGVKYYATNGTLTFESGEASKSFTVRVINGTNIEGSQTVQLLLSDAIVGSSIGLRGAELVIHDDESAGSIEFDQAVYAVNENAGGALITLRRVGGSVGAVSVTYQTSGGTATPGFGSDYLSVTGQVVFAHGQTSTNFVITIREDVLSEGTETIGLLLSTNANSNGAFIGTQGTARIEIVDNDTSFTFIAPGYTVTETGTVATITVLRFGNTNSAATVDFGTTPGSATPGLDYYSTNGTLQFSAGVTNQIFLVRIIDDTLPEGDEYLNLTLSNPSGGATLIPLPTAILNITDNDVTLSFSSPTYSVGESNTLKTISLLRSGATNTSATVQYSITDGTATAGSDYSAANGTLSFPPGVISNGFTATIFDDLIAEGDETVALTLLNPTGALLGGQPTAVLSIIDNDSSVGFSTTSYVVNEKATNAVITLVRKGLASGQVTVVFKTTILGTATVNSDYLAVSNVVTWSDGDLTPKTVLVPIIDDSVLEGSETVNLNLSNPTGGALLEIAAATLFIVDNAGSIAFTSASYTVIEGNNAVLTLTRTGGSNGVVTVQFTASGGSATPGLDYINATGLVAFAHGETTKTLTLPIVDDALVEGLETVQVILSAAAAGARVGSPDTAVVVIFDNEVGVIVDSGSALIGEGTPNGIIDPGETVSFIFSLRNVGSVDTTSLRATLLPGNGVASPSGFQDYGAVIAGGNSVSRPFTFTASGTNGSQLNATLLLTDGAITNGYVTFTYIVGSGAVTFASANPITINDHASASPYPAAIVVAGVAGNITKVTVKLNNLTHGFPDDLDIALVGPHGQVVMLMSDSGGGNSLNNVTLTFDDAAASGLPDSAAISTGTYRPSNNGVQSDPFTAPGPVFPFSTLLSSFNGTAPNGIWSLFIMDDTSQDNGLVAGGWSVTLTTSGGLPAGADLSVSASDSPDPVLLNGTLTYSISVTNHGPGTATNVLFTNLLPLGVSFSSASSSQGSVSSTAGQVTGNLGNLTNGEFATVIISVTAPNFSTVLTNIASVTALQTDLNLGNNVASVKTTVTTVTIVPALSFSLKSSSFVVTWPAVANNFVLQVTPTFTPADWANATNAVQNISGTNTVSVPLSTGASRFYRLRMVP